MSEPAISNDFIKMLRRGQGIDLELSTRHVKAKMKFYLVKFSFVNLLIITRIYLCTNHLNKIPSMPL